MNVRTLISATVVSLCLSAGGLLAAPAALAVTPPAIEETSVVNVAGTSATFRAAINPEGSETTYRFEYGTSEAYGSSVPVPDGVVGAGSVSVPVAAHAQGLAPATEYHYRVVAVVAARSEAVLGSDGTFTTQPAGGEFALPDGRQWELVSPPSKHGALILPIETVGGGAVVQAAEDGSAIMYAANVPTGLEPAGYSAENETRSVRGAQGWSSRDVAVPHSSTTGGLPHSDYLFASSDLSLSLVYPLDQDTVVSGEERTLLSSEATERTPYVRRESLCDAPSTASECYLPVLTGKEGFADVPPGTKFGGTEGGTAELARFAGATPDLQHVVVGSHVVLTATPTKGRDVYEWSAGVPASEAVQLVSVLPESEGGGPAERAYVGADPEFAGTGSRHSISNDGSRIVWLSEENNGFQLYTRDLARKETVRLDVQQPGVPSGGTPDAFFTYASSDGSKVFFTDEGQEQRLMTQSGTFGEDLYECEIVEQAGKLACDLTDVTPASGGQSAEVQGGVIGGSEDGSYVYFVANGVLGDGAEHGATHGTCKQFNGGNVGDACNLYEYHGGAVTYIATLHQDDQLDWGGVREGTARVSPNGRYLAFMSSRSLTGYDNRDAVSGHPDQEVYLYDSASGRLVCVSCNPSGSRPAGVNAREFNGFGRPNIADVFGTEVENELPWVAANMPGGAGIDGGDSLYQPRLLSDSGRLLFNSSDALVAQDVNGAEDVYEFEPEGVGGCSAASVTFSAKTGGCVSLISSGTAPGDSGLLDTSVGGGDVFFLTQSRLTSQDYDTAYDVYTAHECTAAVPCVAQPVSPPPCDSGDSCKAAPAPQPALFGAPASETFSGAGNVVASPPSAPVVGPKSLTRAQKLARALRACGKQPRKRRRACERKAHQRYGAGAARVGAGVTRKGQG